MGRQLQRGGLILASPGDGAGRVLWCSHQHQAECHESRRVWRGNPPGLSGCGKFVSPLIAGRPSVEEGRGGRRLICLSLLLQAQQPPLPPATMGAPAPARPTPTPRRAAAGHPRLQTLCGVHSIQFNATTSEPVVNGRAPPGGGGACACGACPRGACPAWPTVSSSHCAPSCARSVKARGRGPRGRGGGAGERGAWARGGRSGKVGFAGVETHQVS